MKVGSDFRDFYEREFRRVLRATEVFCGDPAVSEDAVQEAFARALARWRRLANRPWVAGWVTTTALNGARRHLRRRPDLATGTPASVDVDAGLDLRRAIRALPTRQQEAVALYYLLDLPVAEVAIAMGCQEGTVKAHLAQARSALARALGAPADKVGSPNTTGRSNDG